VLQIYDRRERTLVSAADALFAAASAVARPFRRREKPNAPARILLLRLERIGDLLMALPAIAAVRAAAPAATIDLVVGSWNTELASAIPHVDLVETLDARWLVRDGAGLHVPALLKHARAWRQRGYDLAINFEPDVRSNLLLAAAQAKWTAGYRSGGGGPLLDEALEYDQHSHTTDNALRLVDHVLGPATAPGAAALLLIPEEHKRRARAILGTAARPLVAVHVSGGRAVKQWEPDRFGDVARRLIANRGATIVLTGSRDDRTLVDQLAKVLPPAATVDASGDQSLLTLAALLDEVELLITGDTGPMHVAAAVGTPIGAVFGPSDPRRYAPRGPLDKIVRIDLPCAPCNRIRLPPARCTGKTPDCLALVTPDRVYETTAAVLDQCFPREQARNASA
jgi:ADP-heptose:LPS heptosyltransferase